MNAIAKHDGSVAHLPAGPMINMIEPLMRRLQATINARKPDMIDASEIPY